MATRAVNYLLPLHLRGLNTPGLLNRSRIQVSHIWITALQIPLISHCSPFLQSPGHEPLALQVPGHYQVKIWGWGWCKCKACSLQGLLGEKKRTKLLQWFPRGRLVIGMCLFFLEESLGEENVPFLPFIHLQQQEQSQINISVNHLPQWSRRLIGYWGSVKGCGIGTLELWLTQVWEWRTREWLNNDLRMCAWSRKMWAILYWDNKCDIWCQKTNTSRDGGLFRQEQ